MGWGERPLWWEIREPIKLMQSNRNGRKGNNVQTCGDMMAVVSWQVSSLLVHIPTQGGSWWSFWKLGLQNTLRREWLIHSDHSASENLDCKVFCEESGLHCIDHTANSKMRIHLAKLAKQRLGNAKGVPASSGIFSLRYHLPKRLKKTFWDRLGCTTFVFCLSPCLSCTCIVLSWWRSLPDFLKMRPDGRPKHVLV